MTDTNKTKQEPRSGLSDLTVGLGADRGHEWETYDDGTINIFAYSPYDPHNGPKCKKCGYGYCHHCDDGPSVDCTAPNV